MQTTRLLRDDLPVPQRRDDAIARAFGLRLKELRQRCGLTQGQLADVAGMTRDAVNKLENGRRNARIDTVVLLAAGMSVDPAELVRGLRP